MFKEKINSSQMSHHTKKPSANTEQQYRQIMALFDNAEDLASTVESRGTKNPEAQLELVEPLIEQVGESADVLSEEFIALHENKGKPRKSSRSRIEGALRKLFMAIENYHAKVKANAATAKNIADGIVEKIRKQVERITLIFLQLLDLSLERIMHKQEIDEFRKFGQKQGFSFSQIGHT